MKREPRERVVQCVIVKGEGKRGERRKVKVKEKRMEKVKGKKKINVSVL